MLILLRYLSCSFSGRDLRKRVGADSTEQATRKTEGVETNGNGELASLLRGVRISSRVRSFQEKNILGYVFTGVTRYGYKAWIAGACMGMV